MEQFLETIGQLIYDADIDSDETNEVLNLITTSYTIVTWPDIQEIMEEDWFDDESFLINDQKGLEKFGSSAYFVPVKHLID